MAKNPIKIFRCKAPFYVQFEITHACNSKCFFCYNPKSLELNSQLKTGSIFKILDDLKDANVFHINFNGGEPLIRKDFCTIAEYAGKLNFSLHMNTNATLITDKIAATIHKYFQCICSTFLGSSPKIHDTITQFNGSFNKTSIGIKKLIDLGVRVEINYTSCKDNLHYIYETAKYCADLGVTDFLISTVIPTKDNLETEVLNKKDFVEIFQVIKQIKDEGLFQKVYLPDPIPFCEFPEFKEFLKEMNVPCQLVFSVVRITPSGLVTPCTVINDVMGDLMHDSILDIWNNPKWEKYTRGEYLPKKCMICDDLPICRGGCAALRTFYQKIQYPLFNIV